METAIRFIAEYYDTKTNEVLESKIIREDKIKNPITIKDLGYLHKEQIELLSSIQNFGTVQKNHVSGNTFSRVSLYNMLIIQKGCYPILNGTENSNALLCFK